MIESTNLKKTESICAAMFGGLSDPSLHRHAVTERDFC